MIRKIFNYWKIVSGLGVDHGNLYLPLMDCPNPEWKAIEKLFQYLD